MKMNFYIPVYEWGDENGHGGSFGCTCYSSLQDLYGFENQDGKVVGHFEVSGEWPPEDMSEQRGLRGADEADVTSAEQIDPKDG